MPTRCPTAAPCWRAGPVANALRVVDRAYKGDETRRLVEEIGMTPVVPPKANLKVKWDNDLETYKCNAKNFTSQSY